ncbi:DUF805 domain-containing protein [Sphingomonas sp. 2R-10]|uniref:DUF805 domain-containing protein n=1 Tax=Sphingomonas sp. 2R-10 TaxID=3045148 RepID=UPI001F499B07|nr:DUF805 domain-containing protein [Sphingomonas sp. 2R-10]
MVLNMIAGMAAGVPMVFGIVRNMAAFAAAHPDRATVTSGPGQYSVQIDGPVPPELMLEPMRGFMPVVAIVALLSVLLLAAAVVRRLHDSGRRGWWGLLPLPFLATGLIAMIVVFGRVGFSPAEPDVVPFVVLFLNNILYLAALALLVVQLCRPSDPGPNRFGPPLD